MKLSPRRLVRGAAPYLVFAAAFLTYDHVLTYAWTAPDTFSLILGGRIESLADLVRILTEPLMARSKVYAMYYRPLSTLTFSLDYAIWGLNPFGYHLTDLLLHGLVAVMIYFAVRTLHPRRTPVAVLAGLLYTLHPLLMEIVPGIERRQDLLPMALMLGALVAAVRAGRPARGRWYRPLALTLYTLTLTAKEIGIILLPLLALYRYLYQYREGSIGARIVGSLRSLIDFGLVTAFYLAWWLSVAGMEALSHGGIARQFIVRDTVPATLRRLVEWGWLRVYVGSLYPWQPWVGEVASFRTVLESAWFHPHFLNAVVSGILVVGTGALIGRYSRGWFRRYGTEGMTARTLQGAMVGAGMLLFFLAASLPLVALLGEHVVTLAYHDPGLPVVTDLMEGRDQIELSTYLGRLQSRLARLGHRAVDGLFVVGLLASLVSAWRHRSDYGDLVTPRRVRWIVWYGTWVLLPGVLYTVGLNFAFRLMYPVIIPVCILLAHFTDFAFRWSLASASGGGAPGTGSFRPDRFVVLLAAVAVAAGLVRYSPWFEPYPAWDCAQRVTHRYLTGIERELAAVSPGEKVVFDRVPMNVIALKPTRPRVHSAGIFGVDSIPSWLRLRGRWKERSHRIGEFRHVRGRCPREVRLTTRRTPRSEVVLEAAW